LISLQEIAKLERIAFNAWRARDLEYLGDWILRANDGITRRANSVLPVGSPKMQTNRAVEDVVAFYEMRQLPPRFQMSPACEPDDLDDVLDQSGFEIGLSVEIRTATIDKVANRKKLQDVELSDYPTRSWLEAYARGGDYDSHSIKTRKGIMDRSRPDKVFASVSVDDEIVGVGFGVREESWVGLFSLATLNGFRRKGVATSINAAIAKWGVTHGAKLCYLQVEARNKPALELYGKMGFKEVYRYWYRVKNDKQR
jgi:GNAT superfamily N-acetyltransferase